MKTIAISKRVLKELFRDPRTIALMFIAPLLILTLMNIVFSVNSSTSVKLATVNVEKRINTQLKRIKDVSIQETEDLHVAKERLKTRKVDGIIEYKDNQYDVTYANTDAGKTAMTKAVLSAALTANTMQTMKDTMTNLSVLNAKKQSQTQAKPTINNHYVYGNSKTSFMDKMIPILMGFFVFFFVFLISGMALLRERTTGTLDRLLATPVKRSEIVFGYMLSYGALASIQTLIIVLFTIHVLGVEVLGNVGYVLLLNILLAFVALSFGILMSTFAKSEFQMMQFIPVIVIPQVFFSGIIPLDSMAHWIKYLSYFLPLSYVAEAMNKVILYGEGIESFLPQLSILLLFLVVLTTLNITGLKRYRKV